MGSDSGNAARASAGHGLQRSPSKVSLGGGSALSRSSSKGSLAGMVSDASKSSLRRSPSRAQLIPPDVPIESRQAGEAQPASPPRAGTSDSAIIDSHKSSPGPDSQPQGHSVAPPLLKRSHSMDHIDTVKAPAVSEGQKAVESISGKVALPNAPIRAIPGSKAPAHIPENEISERGRVVIDEFGPASATIQGADRSDSVSPTSEPAFKPAASSSNSNNDPKQSARSTAEASSKYLAPVRLPSNINLASPRDDASAQPEAEQRVDYFSHNWNESDIAGSWRYIISRRQDMANSARLENASWRMWAKAKNGLATVPPSTVNWLKDYDVTWLYGPLYHEPDSVYDAAQPQRSSRTGSVSPRSEYETDNIDTAHPVSKHGCYPKSILKKKTLAQLMLEEAHELEQNTATPPPHTRTTANYIRHHHYRPVPLGVNRQMVADILNQQYASVPSHSGPVATPGSSEQASANDSPAGSEVESRSSTPGGTPSRRPVSLKSFRSTRSGSLASLSTLERHVHFNDRVEQCVALDPEDDEVESERPKPLNYESSDKGNGENALNDEDDEDEDEDEEEDEDDNAGLFLGLRRPSIIDIKAHEHGCNIIASLPATTLKYEGEDEEDTENRRKEDAVKSMLSSSRRPGFNAHYQPHPVQTQKVPSYQIVDPTIRPVDFKAHTPTAAEEDTEPPPPSPSRKVRPAASFG